MEFARKTLDTTPVASAQGARPRKRPLLYLGVTLRTSVYIDGFNLYFGALKGTPYRWLDVAKLCEIMLPKNEITAIKYFTALVKPRPYDEHQPIRQQTYLRALKTIKGLLVIYGHFLSHEVMMPLAESTGDKQKYIKVIKTEEKGSDVNIATHLLNDAYNNRYDMAVVVSNDSDLVEPIRIVIADLKKANHPSRSKGAKKLANRTREVTQILEEGKIRYNLSYLPGTLKADEFLLPENKKLLHELISFCLFSEAKELNDRDLKFAEDMTRLLSYRTDTGLKLNLSLAAITIQR